MSRPPLNIAALFLAAGRSQRMGPINKLLVPIKGKLLISRSFEIIVTSSISQVIVVLGHEAERIQRTLQPSVTSMHTAGRSVLFTVNTAYHQGLSSSLRCGLDVVPSDVDGVLVYLGDMPFVASLVIEDLLEAFYRVAGEKICVPTIAQRRGNPILWPSSFFDAIKHVQGDRGARSLLEYYPSEVYEVSVSDTGIFIDVDTPVCLAKLTAKVEENYKEKDT